MDVKKGARAMVVTAKKNTYKDYEQLPEGAPYQLIDGELVMTPSPTYGHQRVIRSLVADLLTYLAQNPVGEIIFAPMDVYLSETEVYQPDIVFISNKRRHIIQERIQGVPDLIIEVISPANAYYDLVHKKNAYEATGVQEYWIVDPQEKTIEVFENRDGEFKTLTRKKLNGTVSSRLLEGFSVSLERLFSN
jgi:Uma2 family endonuclease